MDSDSEPRLETERLILRPFTLEDVVALNVALHADAEVMRYLPGGVPRSMDQTEDTVNSFIRHRTEHGYGGWAVTLRENDRLIGQCGLNRMSSDGAVEIFYAVARDCWNKGYTTEAARTVLREGFEEVRLETIIAVAVPENTASRRIMEKLGMSYQGITEKYYNAPLALYTLSRADWAAQSK